MFELSPLPIRQILDRFLNIKYLHIRSTFEAVGKYAKTKTFPYFILAQNIMSHGENSDKLVRIVLLVRIILAESCFKSGHDMISPFLTSNKYIKLEHVFTCNHVFIHRKLIVKQSINSLHNSVYFQFSFHGFLE